MPSIPEALGLARQALDAGDFARAASILQEVLAVAPEEPIALNGMAEVAIAAGRLDEAADYVCRAIARVANEPAFHNNLCEIRRQQGRLEEAVASCQRALELSPNSPQLHSNLGVVYRRQGNFELAVANFQRALELDPRLAFVHYNLGNAYMKLDRLDLAEASFQRALELAPGHPDMHLNFGNTLQMQGRNHEALSHFEAAMRARPDFGDAHHGRASIWLLLGNYAQGWPEYEWRWKASGILPPSFTQPLWQGQPLEGRTILLVAEQGLGDTLHFIRYAPLVKRRGGRVVLQCPQALHELLHNSQGIDQFISSQESLEAFDYYAPLLSLPAIFGTLLETVPGQEPYLFAEGERVARWRQAISGGAELKVGIAWQGSPTYSEDSRRSFSLEYLLPLAACGNVKLFSLQKNFGREQLTSLGERAQIVDLGATLDEGTGAFVDTAAAMMSLDLVITPDTALAHLAAGLGVRVWVALQYATNWRWLVDRDDSPWYPTLRLFRQSRRGIWDDVFARIEGEVQALAARASVR